MQTGPLVKLGRYELKEKIAAGGMAAVYRAIQTGVGGFRSVVAVKILHPHLANDRQFRKMFLDEARIGALLKHRCLLNVLDYGEEGGVSYIVEEFFPSRSVEDFVEKFGKLPVAAALYVLGEAAEGLHALHEASDLEGKKLGLVHRDVSPHNILLGNDGRVKLIDYGIVKKGDPTEKTRGGVVKGKLRYMAPEQACGGPVTPRSDLYSLGLVFLRCVTGQKPHGTGNTAEIMARAKTGTDWEKLVRREKLPDSIKKMLARLLSPDPGARHASGHELASEARKLLSTLEPGYDGHRFRSLLEERNKKAERGSRRTRKDGDLAVSLPRSRSRSGGVHPGWVFLGLASLFTLAALLSILWPMEG